MDKITAKFTCDYGTPAKGRPGGRWLGKHVIALRLDLRLDHVFKLLRFTLIRGSSIILIPPRKFSIIQHFVKWLSSPRPKPLVEFNVGKSQKSSSNWRKSAFSSGSALSAVVTTYWYVMILPSFRIRFILFVTVCLWGWLFSSCRRLLSLIPILRIRIVPLYLL